MGLEYLSELTINQFIALSLAEDVGDGDHSSLCCIDPSVMSKAKLIIKGNGILAGFNLAERILLHVDSSLKFVPFLKDGMAVKYGDIGFEVHGSALSILKAERLLLNCMQRMSGIATKTNRLVKMIEGTNAKLLDTRKTTPNFRPFEKWAVLIGGGKNHRYNLADMIMLKDNHIDYAGGIVKAVENAKTYVKEKGLSIGIEVETRNLAEVKEALSVDGIQRIMLDNMSCEKMVEAIKLINGKTETEASGGITEETIVDVAKTGIDYISMGALTHSYTSLDISLKAF
ncbi:MAG: carboxylating nicotinate-nucleotide diphosphorylase [Cyclobacteriaceae bacterium]